MFSNTHIIATYSLAVVFVDHRHHQTARLYRKALKTLSSWVIDRNIFLDEATALRSRFDANRGCDAARAVRLLRVSVCV